METKSIHVINAISATEAIKVFTASYKGIVRVCPSGLLGREVDVHFLGDGVVEKVKSVSMLRVDIVLELENGSVDEFIRLYSQSHPEYKPRKMTKKQYMKFKKLKGITNNLHPIEVI